MIRFNDVKKKKSELFSINNLNFTISNGEVFGVIGKSGSGKTSVLNLIIGLDKPDEGTINIEDSNNIGYVFQHFNLVKNLNVIDNIMLPLKLKKVDYKERYEKALNMLNYVGLNGFQNKYPYELSGGEKQRIGIARALIKEPTVLLCDEITSALDLEIAYEIMGLLKKIYEDKKMTIVFVTHDFKLVKDICQKAIVLENGSLKEMIEISEKPFTGDLNISYKDLIRGLKE